jgi:hypothetical protein
MRIITQSWVLWQGALLAIIITSTRQRLPLQMRINQQFKRLHITELH